jgi:hypothetical protein
VIDGVRPENIYATDLHRDNWDFGYELFHDKDQLNTLFIPGNILDHDSTLWQLQGKVRIIYAGSLLHLYDRKHQVLAITHMIKLLAPGPEVLIVGRIHGNVKPGDFNDGNSTVYRHDVASFKKMFHEASDQAVGENWETSVKLEKWKPNVQIKTTQKDPEGSTMITFVARRLARLDASTSHHFVF